MFIESINNNIVKQTVSLQNKKYRDEFGLFVIEGEKQVLEIPENCKIEYIILTEKYKNFNFEQTKVYTVTETVFKKISDTKTPQGILAVVKKPKYDIEEITKNKGIFIILDCLQDPGNLGNIIRTASAYNCKGIFISKNSVDVFSPKVVRSSMGTIFNVPVVQETNILDLLKILKQKNITTYALALQTDNFLSQTKFENNIAFIIGNESNGISEEVLNNADKILKIEMLSTVQSLNAAIASSIAIYEGAKQVYAGKFGN